MTYSFNLISEKWIPCRLLNSPVTELKSLEEALLEARQISEIVGDAPPVTISLYRLLLAVVHRALGVLKMSDFNRDWELVWKAEAFDAENIKSYLRDEKIYSRFDLFNEKYPFYQATNTVAPKPDEDTVARLFFQMDNNPALFDHNLVKDPPALTPDEAARWLIAFHSFHVRGKVKTDVMSKEFTDKTDKKKLNSARQCPLVGCAVGLIRGKNLFETLTLNLYWNGNEFFRSFGEPQSKDKPAWERDEPTRAYERPPDGYLDLLTWQSRRIRLFPEYESGRTVVKQAVVMDGYRFPKGDFQLTGKETMVAFKKVEDPSAQKPEEALGFKEGRALWRDSYSLFHHFSTNWEKPLMLNWLNGLADAGTIKYDQEFAMDFFGLAVSRAKPLFWKHERLPLEMRYLQSKAQDEKWDEYKLAALNDELRRALKVSESIANILVASVRRLTVLLFYLPNCHLENPTWFKPLLTEQDRKEATNEQKARETKKKRDLPQEINQRVKTFAPELRYWSRLEDEFRRVLVALARDFNLWKEQRERWAKVLGRVALQSFNEIAIGLGQSSRTLRAVAIAERWLKAEMGLRQKKYLASQEVEEGDENQEGGDEE